MKNTYAYSALSQMTPERVSAIREELKEEYAELLQEHHNNCASILFYQGEIKKMQPK